MPSDWSEREVRVAVEAYFDMLSCELQGIPYNKTEVRARVLPQLNDRSHGSLEFKNCNISAAPLDLGYPSIDGYKPRANYQRTILPPVIERVLLERPDLTSVVERTVKEELAPHF